MLKRLKIIVENSDTKTGRIFDIFIQILIVISLISFTIETLPNLKQSTYYSLWVIEVITVIIFSIEYFLRILVSDSKIKFIFSFYGLIDFFCHYPVLFINRN